MDLEKAVVVKTFLNLTDADFAAAQLRSSGMDCAITADDAAGAYPGLALIRLLVDPIQINQARQVLNELPEFEASQLDAQAGIPPSSPQPPAAPPRLAEFGWGLLVGVGVGVLLHWAYSESQQFGRHSYKYDFDRDGVLDEESVWRNGELVELRRDLNGDGRIDCRTYYVKGVPTREEADDNFDGRTDVWYTCDARGLYSSVRFDTDFNGVADVVSTFKNGIVTQTDWQPNGTNVITLRQLFEHGVLKEELRDEDWDGKFDVSIKYDPFANPVQTNRLKLLSTPAR